MDSGAWEVILALATIAGSIFGSVAAVSFRTGTRLTEIKSALDANALAIARCASVETVKSLESDVTRLEAADGELHKRIDRQSQRIDKVEEAHAARETATAAILGRLEAGLSALRESVERLIEAEREQRTQVMPQTAPTLIDQLNQLVALKNVVKQLG